MKDIVKYRSKLVKEIIKTLRDIDKPWNKEEYTDRKFTSNKISFVFEIKPNLLLYLYKNGNVDIYNQTINFNLYQKFLLKKEIKKFIKKQELLYEYKILKDSLDL